jgi:hypothetical protein
MDANTTFSLRGAEGSDAKTEETKRASLRQIATGSSLVGLTVGFSILGAMIIVNCRHAHLKDLPGGAFVAVLGGICAILVGAFFFVAYCLHRRFCTRHSTPLRVRREPAGFTFARPELAPSAGKYSIDERTSPATSWPSTKGSRTLTSIIPPP